MKKDLTKNYRSLQMTFMRETRNKYHDPYDKNYRLEKVKGENEKKVTQWYTSGFIYYICINDLQGNQMKASAVSTITKSLPTSFSILVSYSLLADLRYINIFK